MRRAILCRARRTAKFQTTMQFGDGLPPKRKIMSAGIDECLFDRFGHSNVSASNEHEHSTTVNSIGQPF